MTLEEAAHGVEKEISIQKKEKCDACHGTGGKAGSKPTRCSTCQGRGKITMRQGFMVEQICP